MTGNVNVKHIQYRSTLQAAGKLSLELECMSSQVFVKLRVFNEIANSLLAMTLLTDTFNE